MIWSLRQREEFDRLARDGRTVRTENLWCRYLNDPLLTPLRVGFAIGRACGPATRRNRLRRRLRALIGELSGAVGMHNGYLLVGARPSAPQRTFGELRDELEGLLREAASVATAGQ